VLFNYTLVCSFKLHKYGPATTIEIIEGWNLWRATKLAEIDHVWKGYFKWQLS